MHLVAVGGSDAGISAALRARELDPTAQVSVVVADAFPNFSICAIPYYVSGDVADWRNLAHRSVADLEDSGMRLRLERTARRIDVHARQLLIVDDAGVEDLVAYDAVVIGTGATPIRPPIDGLVGDNPLGPAEGVHLLHSMGDTSAVMGTLEQAAPRRAVIVGPGYIGLEMAEAFVARGLQVTQIEQLPEALPTVDADLGQLARAELVDHGVEVLTNTTVTKISRHDNAAGDCCGSRRPPPTAPRCRVTRASFWSAWGSAPTPHSRRRPAQPSAPGAPSPSIGKCGPTWPTCSPPVTARSPTTASSATPTSRSARPPTNRAGSPARTPSEVTAATPAASEPKS